MMLKVTMVCVWAFCSSFFVFASEDVDSYLAGMVLEHESLAQKEELEALLKDPEYEPKIRHILRSNIESIQDLSRTNIDVLMSYYASNSDVDSNFSSLCKIGFLRAGVLRDKEFLEKAMDKILFSPIAWNLFMDIKDSFDVELRGEVEERIAVIEFAKEIEENNLMEQFAQMSIQGLEEYLSECLSGRPKAKEAVLVSLYMCALDISSEEMITQEIVDEALQKAKTLGDTDRTAQDFEQMAGFLKDFIASGKIKS
jgi:hypothetical protein